MSAFGSVVFGGGATTPFLFGGGNGSQTDADAGLVLMGSRYYDSRIGRFISQDPAGDGDNWYAYCDNSPTNEIDPMGLDPIDFQPANDPDGYHEEPGSQWSNGHEGGETLIPNSITYPSFSFSHTLGVGLSMADANLTFGRGAALGGAIGAYRSGHGSGWAVAGAGLLFAGAVAINFIPGEEEANVGVRVTAKGLGILERHLGTFEEFAPNQAMISRLRSVIGKKVSSYDANFYLHEISEATMMGKGMSYDEAHAAAMAKYGVNDFQLYHPDVVSANREWFNKNYPGF